MLMLVICIQGLTLYLLAKVRDVIVEVCDVIVEVCDVIVEVCDVIIDKANERGSYWP